MTQQSFYSTPTLTLHFFSFIFPSLLPSLPFFLLLPPSPSPLLSQLSSFLPLIFLFYALLRTHTGSYYGNRAATWIMLKEFQRAVDDCVTGLTLEKSVGELDKLRQRYGLLHSCLSRPFYRFISLLFTSLHLTLLSFHSHRYLHLHTP